MGFLCCFGSADTDDAAPRLAKPTSTVAVQRSWQVDAAWTAQVSNLDKSHVSETMHQRVRRYVNTLYPQCALVGSIEDMGESRARLRDGTCSPHTHHDILVLDDNFTGVIYSVVMVLNLPTDADMAPRKWLDSPEMDEAKFYLIQMLENVASQHNARHAVARIFIGNDAMVCKFRPDNLESTLEVLDSDPPPHFRKSNDEMARALRKLDDVPKGAYRGFAFEFALQTLYETFPGCTVWDEGALDLSVSGKPLTEPTRLLVARRFNAQPEKDFQPDESVDATVFRVSKAGDQNNATVPLKLLQARGHQKFPGGIVAIILLVATPMSEIWPKCGAYTKSVAMKAAKAAGLELLTRWNLQGRLECCNLMISMGADRQRFKFISEKFCSGVQSVEGSKEEGLSTVVANEHASLDPFFVHLVEEREHELFQSEIQFQAIKQQMRQRAAQDPQRYRAMAPHLALMSAQYFLETNYPGCAVLDEGEFPITANGKASTIHDTRLVVAKDPAKETNNIVAALHLVPLPGDENSSWVETCDKTWIGSKEMSTAEEALRVVLQQWYKEGKLADDCMAQVIMGTDATIYRFVDGDRFEDYSEERQSQFRWG